MNIPKAIEILSDSAYGGSTTFNEKFKESQKLLIEAGKEVTFLRSHIGHAVRRLLPGETEE